MVTEARKGFLRLVGNQPTSAKAEGSLTVRPTSRTGTTVGFSHPQALTRKVAVHPDNVHTRMTRQRRIATWGGSRSQGLGCSPIKAVRELGSERRETVRSISGVCVGILRGFVPSTRGPGGTHLWCTSYRANGKRWVAMCGVDNR